jgi:D-alanyl-D-alanine carboxypeptidase (penicillin-binding protein 5/6)
MRSTYFKNASGWHHKSQYTTASDLVKLVKALRRDFPEFYPLFKKTNFLYNGVVINGHNKVTKHYPGAEGLKTGYTSAAGFNLITVASNGNKRVAGVVIGHPCGASRDKKMVELLNSSLKVNFTISPTEKSSIIGQNKTLIASKPTKEIPTPRIIQAKTNKNKRVIKLVSAQKKPQAKKNIKKKAI